MFYARRIATSGFVFVASAFAASYGHAQSDASPAVSRGLEEITVTANKREESLSKVGSTVTALGGAQLEQRRVATLQDLTAAVPGLIYTQTETATPVITLRGIGFYDSSLAALPAVTTYIDQAPLPFPVETTLALFDLERVEVLKGPQGTLFGNNATGGAINYIAAKPTWEPEAGITVSYGRFNTLDTDAHISGPLVKDQLAARLAIKTTDGDGWQKSATQKGVTNGAPDNIAGRLLLDWKPTDRLRVQTNFNGWRDRTPPEQGQFVTFIPSFADGIPPAPLFKLIPNANTNPQTADWTTSPYSPKANNKLLQATIRADYDVTDAVALTSIVSYTDYLQTESPIGTGLNANRANFFEDDGRLINKFAEVRLAQNKDPVFRWTIGGNYEHDDMSEYQYNYANDGTAAYTPDFFGVVGQAYSASTSFQSANTYAGFANAEYTMDQLTFKGGVRYTKYDRTATNCTFAINNDPFLKIFGLILGRPPFQNGQCFNFNSTTFQPGAFTASLSEHNVSWRGGVDWKPTDTILAYANVAKGYKGGSIPTLAGATDTSFVAAKQESVLTEEVGGKFQFSDRRLLVNVAAYHSNYNNKQIKSKLLDPVFAYLPALVNVPKSEITGAELELSARPIEALTVGAAANYVHSELKNTIGPDGKFLISNTNSQVNDAGNPIPYAPKWSLAANFNYDFPIGTLAGFFGGQIQYTSKTNASIGNEPIENIPGHYTADIQTGADFSDGKYRLMFWAKNVTNEFYITNRNFSFDGVVQFPGMPRTYGVTLSAKL